MKNLLLIISLLPTLLLAQDNLQLQFGYRGTVAAAKYLPSTQEMEDTKFEIGMDYNLWISNKNLTFSSLKSIYFAKELTNEDINKIIDESEQDNRIGSGQDFLLMGIGYKHDLFGRPAVFNLTVSDRFLINSAYPTDLLRLVWQGNRQFTGQTVDLSNAFINGLYFREFSLGIARHSVGEGDWQVRTGLRLNYYFGLTGIDNPTNKFRFTTAEDGEYLEFDSDFKYQVTGMGNFGHFDPKGHGFGANLGATFAYKERLKFDLGLTDLGFIKFSKDVISYSSNEAVTFTGLDENAIKEPRAYFDSLLSVFRARSEPNANFTMPVGAKFSFMASYVWGKTTIQHGPKTVYFFYTQGFSENPGVTLTPKFTLAFHRPMFKRLRLGASTSWGGFNTFAVGGLVGIEFKHLHIGVHSDDFTGLIFPERTTGGGGGFLVQISW